MIQTPLNVIGIAHRDDTEAGDYLTSVQLAFAGRTAEQRKPTGYFGSGDDTHVQSLTFRPSSTGTATAPAEPAPDFKLGSTLHTLFVLICDHGLLADEAVCKHLDEVAAQVADSQGQHRLVIFSIDERSGKRLVRKYPNIGKLQVWSVSLFGEEALRTAHAAIYVLHEAHKLLQNGMRTASATSGPGACFFISHAKIDGLPLAATLRHQLDQLKWLKKFYDTEDVLPGDDWVLKLRDGVLNSMLLVLRTDIFDTRPWCRQEVMWAEEHGRPILVVEARTELVHSPSALPFSGAPTVRIPDGNVIRILVEALREWVRLGVAERRIHELKKSIRPSANVVFLPRVPTLASLVRTCINHQKSGAAPDTVVLYPDPPLESGFLEAARCVVRNYFPNGDISTHFAHLASLS